jgi:hypothetical protein
MVLGRSWRFADFLGDSVSVISQVDAKRSDGSDFDIFGPIAQAHRVQRLR